MMTHPQTETAKYTSKILKASALVAETRSFFHHWDEAGDVPTNLKRYQEENPLALSSRSRLEDVLGIFRRRYLEDPCVTAALSILVKGKVASVTLHQILYYFTLRADDLLFDFVTQVLLPRYRSGRSDISTAEVESLLEDWCAEGRMAGSWSANTRNRVAQQIMTTLRDFGLLTGAVQKRIDPSPMSVGAFGFIAFDLFRRGAVGRALISHPMWEAFLLDADMVERNMLAAHKEGILQYASAGSIIRLDFPTDCLTAYARMLSNVSIV